MGLSLVSYFLVCLHCHEIKDIYASAPNLKIKPKLLYIDGLNYATRIFPRGRKWSCKAAFGFVRGWVTAARASSCEPKVFLDDANLSYEAKAKWKRRIEKDIRRTDRNVPQGTGSLIGDMFRAVGVDVVYSREADNDDTIVFHAHADGAAILSSDKDMFRYDSNCVVYSAFHIEPRNKGLTLIRHPRQSEDKRYSSFRPLAAPPAVSSYNAHLHDGVYLRGIRT